MHIGMPQCAPGSGRTHRHDMIRARHASTNHHDEAARQQRRRDRSPGRAVRSPWRLRRPGCAEWLDGCMAALLAGPRAVTPRNGCWLCWAMPGSAPSPTRPTSNRRWQTLLARWSVLASQLDAEALFDAPEALRLSPLLGDHGEASRRVAGRRPRSMPRRRRTCRARARSGRSACSKPSMPSAPTGRSPSHRPTSWPVRSQPAHAVGADDPRRGRTRRRSAAALPGKDARPRRADRRGLLCAAGSALLLGRACTAPCAAARGADAGPQRRLAPAAAARSTRSAMARRTRSIELECAPS